jgi:hypothetical protein
MGTSDHEESGLDPGDRRQAAALNHLLGQIGLSKDERSQWWNLVVHSELGGRTATQAWIAGDAEAVTALVEQWYAASADAAGRAGRDPEFLALLRRKLTDLDEQASRGGSLHRSA